MAGDTQTLGNLQYVLTADDRTGPAIRGAISGLSQLQSAASSAGSSVVSSITRVVGSLAKLGGIGAAIGGTAAAIGGLIGVGHAVADGFHNAAEIEKYTASLAVMTGSAEKAAKVLGDVAKFAGTTPFSLKDLEELSVKLSAFGVKSEQLIPTLRTLGDLAQGDAQKFKELATIYGKLQTSKVVQLEDLNQIADKGIPVFDELAKVLGITAEEVRKLVSTGTIRFGAIQQVFANLTAQGSKFGGSMAAMANTSGGAWTKMEAAFQQVFIKIAQTFNKVFGTASALNSVTNFVAGIQKTLVSGIEIAFSQVREIIGGALKWIKDNQDQLLQAMSTVAISIKDIWDGAASFVSGALSSISGFFASSATAGETWADRFEQAFARVVFGFKNVHNDIAIDLEKMTAGFYEAIGDNDAAQLWRDTFEHEAKEREKQFADFVKSRQDRMKKLLGTSPVVEVTPGEGYMGGEYAGGGDFGDDEVKFKVTDPLVAEVAKEAAKGGKGSSSGDTTVAALDRGSAAEYSAIAKLQSNMLGDKQLKAEQETAKNTKVMADNMKVAAAAPVPVLLGA